MEISVATHIKKSFPWHIARKDEKLNQNTLYIKQKKRANIKNKVTQFQQVETRI
jgi:hypothetical protein